MAHSDHELRWDQLQEKGGMLPLRIILWFYQRLGRHCCVLIIYIVVWWYWLFAAQARQHSRHYLRTLHQFAASASPFSKVPTAWHSYQHLRVFALSILDKISGWLGEVPEQQLQIFGHQHFQRYYQQGAILIVSHFGNIELLRAIKSNHHQIVNVLVYRQHARQFNAFLQHVNPKAAVRLIPVEDLAADTALYLQQCLDAGEWIVVAADRVPVNSKRQQCCNFLGQAAMWPEGAWLLAHLLSAPVMAVFCYPYRDELQVHIEMLAENLSLPRSTRQQQLQHYMQQYVSLLEQHCLRAPYQWFNFYDFWKQQ